MGFLLRKVLPYIILIFIVYACDRDTQSNDLNCNENSIIETYSDIQGKVFINNQFFTYNGDTAYIYAITISIKDFYSDKVTFFHSESWTIMTDSILVPVNLTDDFKINDLRIRLSGNKLDCCQELTQPNWRVGYGCKFIITDIRKY
jgi:hypothetical protein